MKFARTVLETNKNSLNIEYVSNGQETMVKGKKVDASIPAGASIATTRTVMPAMADEPGSILTMACL